MRHYKEEFQSAILASRACVLSGGNDHDEVYGNLLETNSAAGMAFSSLRRRAAERVSERGGGEGEGYSCRHALDFF